MSSEMKYMRLEEISDIIMGQSPDSQYYNEDGIGYPFLQGSGNFGSKYPKPQVYCKIPSKISPVNSILISVRAPVGEINLSNEEYCIGRGLAAIIPKEVDLNYLFYSIELNKNDLRRVSQGSTFDAINSQELKELKVLCPVKIKEQRLISQRLNTLDKIIEKTEFLIDKYRKIKQGLMFDLFTAGATKERYDPNTVVENMEIGQIPEDWKIKRLVDLCSSPIRDFGSFSSTKLITFLNDGVPFIKSEMIKEGAIDWSSVTYISNRVHQLLSKSYVKEGTVLFSKIGSALGKAVVYEGERGECNSNAAVAKIELNDEVADKYFICYYLNFELTQQRLKRQIVSLLPRINLGDLSNLLVTLPEINEQRRIAAILRSIDKKIEQEQVYRDKLVKIRQGFMQDLLTGKVRVKIEGDGDE